MIIYRRHSCHRRHRKFATFIRCAMPSAEWVQGEGEYAVIAWCGVPTVTLYIDIEAALSARQEVDPVACGGVCQRHHDLVRIDLGSAS